MFSKVKFSFKTGFIQCVHVGWGEFICVCCLIVRLVVCVPNWVIGCLLTLWHVFCQKRTLSALLLELLTWKSPSGASLTHPHEPWKQNMECIPNPAQAYEYKSGGFHLEYLMCDCSHCTVLVSFCLMHLKVVWKLLICSHFPIVMLYTKWLKFTDVSIIITRKNGLISTLAAWMQNAQIH